MINMTTNIATIHGTRVRVGSVVPSAAELPVYGRAWKQRPGVVVLGRFGTDNCTGVSEVEYRLRR
jgi:hypothetical protein